MVTEIEQQIHGIKSSIQFIGENHEQIKMKHLWMLETAMNALDAIESDLVQEIEVN